MKIKKKKLVSTGKLKKKLWKTFSEYIRERDHNVCITCGGRASMAGHFIPKVAGGLSLYFNELNVNAQCFRCNINLGGYGAKYFVELQKKYDAATPFKLLNEIKVGEKWTREEYERRLLLVEQCLCYIRGEKW
jgi:hypothetical protein